MVPIFVFAIDIWHYFLVLQAIISRNSDKSTTKRYVYIGTTIAKLLMKCRISNKLTEKKMICMRFC